METVIYGSLKEHSLEVVERDGRCFVRYDAGSHAIVWREDEITRAEAESIARGGEAEIQAMFELQRRLEQQGVDPYVQNWVPPNA